MNTNVFVIAEAGVNHNGQLDLALQLGRCTLLSRDRAVLRLARRAAPWGVSILAPQRWQK